MPVCEINTNLPRSAIPKGFLQELTEIITKKAGNPKQTVCVFIKTDLPLTYAGTDEPAAHASLALLNQGGVQLNTEWTKILYDYLHEKLPTIPASRIGLEFKDLDGSVLAYGGKNLSYMNPKEQEPSLFGKISAGIHAVHEHIHERFHPHETSPAKPEVTPTPPTPTPTTPSPTTPSKFEALPSDYQRLSAQEKQKVLWKRVQKDAYTPANLPTKAYSPEESRNLFNPEYLVKTFTHISDEVPEGRKKLSHQYGVVGKVQLEILTSSPYTGIFQGPGGIGLARFAWAKFDDPDNVTPNMAIKIFIDGQPSVNLNTMPNLDGQGKDRNFFLQAAFTNPIPKAIPVPLQVALSKAFGAAITLLPPCPHRPEDENTLGMYEQAAVTPSGKPVPEPVAPWKIAFVPNPALRENQAKFQDKDFRIPLTTIPENTVLFDVVAYRQKADEHGEFIGRLVSRGPFVASPYGDLALFFQHTRTQWLA